MLFAGLWNESSCFAFTGTWELKWCHFCFLLFFLDIPTYGTISGLLIIVPRAESNRYAFFKSVSQGDYYGFSSLCICVLSTKFQLREWKFLFFVIQTSSVEVIPSLRLAKNLWHQERQRVVDSAANVYDIGNVKRQCYWEKKQEELPDT